MAMRMTGLASGLDTESMVKELDYQFRSRGEREEERDRKLEQRSEEYYQKMDELLRKKTRGGMWKQQKDVSKAQDIKEIKGEKRNNDCKTEKKKRHFIF